MNLDFFFFHCLVINLFSFVLYQLHSGKGVLAGFLVCALRVVWERGEKGAGVVLL